METKFNNLQCDNVICLLGISWNFYQQVNLNDIKIRFSPFIGCSALFKWGFCYWFGL